MTAGEPRTSVETDLADLAQLTAEGATRDVQLLLARLVRKYRQVNPELSRRLDQSYKVLRARTGLGGPLRRGRGSTAGR